MAILTNNREITLMASSILVHPDGVIPCIQLTTIVGTPTVIRLSLKHLSDVANDMIVKLGIMSRSTFSDVM